jgi:hypothetical protein
MFIFYIALKVQHASRIKGMYCKHSNSWIDSVWEQSAQKMAKMSPEELLY